MAKAKRSNFCAWNVHKPQSVFVGVCHKISDMITYNTIYQFTLYYVPSYKLH